MKPETFSNKRNDWLRFLKRDAHILATRPHLLFQLAVNQPNSSKIRKAVTDFGTAPDGLLWMVRTNRDENEPIHHS